MAVKNLVTKTTIDNLTAELKATFAKKSQLPTKVSDLTNDSNFQTGTQVESAIAAQIGRVYRPAGSVTFANLPTLAEANLGKVVNVTDAFTTTADFVEGAGKKHKAGADVGIVEVPGATEGTVEYKYNVFANFVDTSGQMDKIVGGTTGGLVQQTADGGVEDTGVLAADVVTKVSDGTTGNLAALDANGKLADSGKAPGDFALRDTDAVTNNIAKFDSNGDPVDAGIAAGNVMTKVASATNGNLAGLNASGEATDSGVAAADVQQKLAANTFTAGNIRTTDANGFAQDGGIAATALLVDSDISDYTAAEIAALLAD